MKIKVELTREENANALSVPKGTVMEFDLVTYVACVVASEVGNASLQAAMAQAIAARTYAYPFYSNGLTITDTSKHQAFRYPRVISGDYPLVIQAALDTEGMLLAYGGKVIDTCVYCESNGGVTVDSGARWGGKRPYLISQLDPWDEAISGGERSGHGVGMSQKGAGYAASIGKTYREILAFYYPGTEIVTEGGEKVMNEKAAKVVQTAESQMGSPYVYAAMGAMCTPEERKRRASSHTDHMEAIYKACQVLNGSSAGCAGCKWNGCRCFDCRGFTYWCLKEGAGIVIEGGGATSQYNASANWVLRGEIKDMPDVVCCLFKKNGSKMIHTGLHVGGGKIIHCSAGVQTGSVTDKTWTHYAVPVGLYTADELAAAGRVDVMPTVKKGSRGEAVTMLQTELQRLGYDVGVIDGVFGDRTAAALRVFQSEHGLDVDGICGMKTWAVIKNLSGAVEVPEQETEPVEPMEPEVKQEDVQECGQPVTRAEFEALKREIDRLWHALGIACTDEGEQDNEYFE